MVIFTAFCPIHLRHPNECFGLVGAGFLSNAGAERVRAGSEPNGRSLPSWSAFASSFCQRRIRAVCCSCVSDEFCLLINVPFVIGYLPSFRLSPRIIGMFVSKLPFCSSL